MTISSILTAAAFTKFFTAITAGTSVVLVCEVAPGVASGIDTVALDSLVLPQLRELHEHVRMLMAALNAR